MLPSAYRPSLSMYLRAFSPSGMGGTWSAVVSRTVSFGAMATVS